MTLRMLESGCDKHSDCIVTHSKAICPVCETIATTEDEMAGMEDDFESREANVERQARRDAIDGVLCLIRRSFANLYGIEGLGMSEKEAIADEGKRLIKELKE